MDKVAVTRSKLTDIADAVREVNGAEKTYTLEEIAEEIRKMSGGAEKKYIYEFGVGFNPEFANISSSIGNGSTYTRRAWSEGSDGITLDSLRSGSNLSFCPFIFQGAIPTWATRLCAEVIDNSSSSLSTNFNLYVGRTTLTALTSDYWSHALISMSNYVDNSIHVYSCNAKIVKTAYPSDAEYKFGVAVMNGRNFTLKNLWFE